MTGVRSDHDLRHRRLPGLAAQHLDLGLEWDLRSAVLTDPLLALGAHLRLTRLLTTDVMGGYLVVNPLTRLRDRVHAYECGTREWATGHEHTARCRALSLVLEGLDCPHCCGLWVATGVVLMYVITSRSPRARAAWRAAAAALSLGYVGGHVCARIDHAGEDDDA